MIAFVTGATAGFGEAISRRLVKDGITVIGTGRRKAVLEKLKKELGNLFVPLPFDIQSNDAVTIAIQSLPQGLSEIDILINNAGLALGLDPAQNAKLEDWESMVNTNIKGLLYCTHALLPQMVKRGSGQIINLGSVAGEFPYPGGHVYGATKAFVRQLSLNLKADLVGTGVRITDIEPGLAGGTEFSNVRFKGDDSKAKAVYAGTQSLTAEDIAETVLWVIRRPAHVNINTISMMPTCQGFSPFNILRSK